MVLTTRNIDAVSVPPSAYEKQQQVVLVSGQRGQRGEKRSGTSSTTIEPNRVACLPLICFLILFLFFLLLLLLRSVGARCWPEVDRSAEADRAAVRFRRRRVQQPAQGCDGDERARRGAGRSRRESGGSCARRAKHLRTQPREPVSTAKQAQFRAGNESAQK